jgi:hypothetical protein
MPASSAGCVFVRHFIGAYIVMVAELPPVVSSFFTVAYLSADIPRPFLWHFAT